MKNRADAHSRPVRQGRPEGKALPAPMRKREWAVLRWRSCVFSALAG